MNQKKINLENINSFLSPIEKLTDLKKISLYKELSISTESFFILRFLFRKYVVNGQHTVLVSDLLQSLSNSSFFRAALEKQELEDINIKEKDEEEASNFINMQNYNEIDYFEEDFFEIGFITYIESIRELISFGYLQSSSMNTFDSNPFKLFTEEVALTLDVLEIINFGNLEIKESNEKKEYKDYQEYLVDVFKFIKDKHDFMILSKKLNKKSPILRKKIKESDSLEKQIKLRISKNKKLENPLEDFFKEKKLTDKQKLIVMALFRGDNTKENLVYCTEDNLLSLYYDEIPEILPLKEEMFDLTSDIIGFEYQENPFTGEYIVHYYLNEELLSKITPLPDRDKDGKKEVAIQEVRKIVKENSDFEIIEPKNKIEDIVLSTETNNLVHILLNQLDEKVINQLKEWGIKEDDNINARILFSGKPGTGKTATSYAIGNALNRFVISFDCSKILSMYVGESEKNVKSIFDTYKKIQEKLDYYPILLLNEADQFLSSRSTGQNGSADKMHNQMQNIFLEEIEKFKGILIATTNLVENIDSAFSRRFNHKIDFKIPDEKQRFEIWEKKLKSTMPLEKDFSIEKLSKFELTGGQIELVLENTAMKNAVNKIKKFKTEHFIEEIERELSSSFGTVKTMGFGFN